MFNKTVDCTIIKGVIYLCSITLFIFKVFDQCFYRFVKSCFYLSHAYFYKIKNIPLYINFNEMLKEYKIIGHNFYKTKSH